LAVSWDHREALGKGGTVASAYHCQTNSGLMLGMHHALCRETKPERNICLSIFLAFSSLL